MAKDENKESEIRGDEQEIVDQRLPVWRPQDADREYYRYETKKRIQHYTVPPQTIFRPAKPTPTIRDAEHKTIVCGHWHTSYGHSKYEHKGTEFGEDADFSPYYGPGIIAIDACTAFSGKVNCLVIED